MSNSNKIAIIGAGKVGQSLKQLFTLASIPVTLIGKSSQEQRHAVRNADFTILSVSDSNIEALCNKLAPFFKKTSIVAHCSGALSSRVLESAAQNACYTASIHPLNTFPTTKAALALFGSLNHNTTLYCEGDNQALEALLPLAKQLGFTPEVLASNSKAAYHAACVFACNYLSTLMELSLQTSEEAGLDRTQFWHAIQPLIQATLNNISDHGTVGSLSGPIARGDLTTIDKHLSALSKTKTSYKNLGLETLKLAKIRGELTAQQLSQLETLLS